MMPHRGRTEMEPSHVFYRRRVMGSTGSLLNEGVYERDAMETESRRHKYDEHMLPSKLTPYSGRLDKSKGLVRPIAVRPLSPGSNSSSPRFTKRVSPALSDTIPVNGQPPDVVLTNQRRGITSPNGFMPGSNHFGRPPTKSVSLQEIPPPGNHYSNGVAHLENRGRIMYKKLQPSQSMNFLDHNQRRSHPHQALERRGRSQSHSSIQDQDIPSSLIQLNHRSLSPPPEHHPYDNLSVSSHVSSIIEEVSTDEDIPSLRNRVQELDAQLVSLRQAMEQNEHSILQVQEDKRQEWQLEVTRLKKELETERISATDMEQALQQQILCLEQENARLQEKLERIEEASHNLRNSNHQNAGRYSDENSNLRPELKGRSSRRVHEGNAGEITALREDVQACQRQLMQERAKVEKLEQELELSKSSKWQETPDLVKKQGGTSYAELKRLKTNLDHLNEVKMNLLKQVSIQEDELQALQQKLQNKDEEVAQDRSEIAYLKDIQGGLRADILNKVKDIKQIKKTEISLRSNYERQVREKEVELEAVHSELRELRVKKNQEIAQMEKQVLRKESEVLQLQAQVQENETKAKTKRRSYKGSETSKSTQKQMEQDFIALQVKLTKREQELFQTRREATLKQDNVKEERDSLKKKVSQYEGEMRACRDKLQCRDEELILLQEKLQEGEKEIAGLYGKLDHLQQAQNSQTTGEGKDPKVEKFSGGKEMSKLRSDFMGLAEKLRKREVHFEEEKVIWQKEKAQVLQYQKQLQLNYMQMGQKNHKLEQEIQQLTTELERGDIIEC